MWLQLLPILTNAYIFLGAAAWSFMLHSLCLYITFEIKQQKIDKKLQEFKKSFPDQDRIEMWQKQR